METSIELKQKPIIEHKLQIAGKKVTDRLEKLGIDNLIATLESVNSLKKLRAELNRELNDFETQRKFIKKAIADPYKDFEAIYQNEISKKYQDAIEKLKLKIGIVENKIKEEKEANIKAYFIELCQSENIDFVTFSQLEMDINLSTSEKAYKEKANDFIKKIVDDLALINTQEFQAEILVEFKSSLNASKAIKDVQDRKENERIEKERLKLIETNRRKNKLFSLDMAFDEMTKVFEYDEEIYISLDTITENSKEDFEKIFLELEEKIKAKKTIEFEKEQQSKSPETKHKKEECVIKNDIKQPLKPPVKEVIEEIVTAKFEVKGTYPDLKKLGQYMRDNNLTYKNI